jgi:hypothetical protein
MVGEQLLNKGDQSGRAVPVGPDQVDGLQVEHQVFTVLWPKGAARGAAQLGAVL